MSGLARQPKHNDSELRSAEKVFRKGVQRSDGFDECVNSEFGTIITKKQKRRTVHTTLFFNFI
jgi:hypothetical protein